MFWVLDRQVYMVSRLLKPNHQIHSRSAIRDAAEQSFVVSVLQCHCLCQRELQPQDNIANETLVLPGTQKWDKTHSCWDSGTVALNAGHVLPTLSSHTYCKNWSELNKLGNKG